MGHTKKILKKKNPLRHSQINHKVDQWFSTFGSSRQVRIKHNDATHKLQSVSRI